MANWERLISAAQGQVKNETDVLALALHYLYIDNGFINVDYNAGACPNFKQQSDGSICLEVVPAGWNSNPDVFSFTYTHPLSPSSVFFMKAVLMGNRLAVNFADNDGKSGVQSLDLCIKDEVGTQESRLGLKRLPHLKERFEKLGLCKGFTKPVGDTHTSHEEKQKQTNTHTHTHTHAHYYAKILYLCRVIMIPVG
eukprot:GHVR01043463.1.p2 GENE.GHVR01043463.1~~GHVR01043463.1.p2  ORF type:complete len:196 (-),score=60.38 GHVR01043463.1:2099-2686(-)